ncbi:hypothetical protein [Streptomyces sp. NPDC056255]|uniref:hypothetical protein n=1 Tax=Streptomyces sp. NPDC056255 TaxID=3345764 RepID=UPI0035D98E0F
MARQAQDGRERLGRRRWGIKRAISAFFDLADIVITDRSLIGRAWNTNRWGHIRGR